jgi:hypothetical protein
MSLERLKAVQPLTVVDKSDISPTCLTFPLEGPYSLFSEGNPPAHFKQRECFMNVQVFLLVILLIIALALMCALCLPHHGLVQLRAAAKVRTKLQRLLKPRTPDDCPACRLASPASSAGVPAPVHVRPWSEVKSRRGAAFPYRYRGLCLSQPAVSVLWQH